MAAHLMRVSLRQALKRSANLGAVYNLTNVRHDSTKSPKWNNNNVREDLATAYRGIFEYGLSEGICNHLTAIAPARKGKDYVALVIPYGLHWCEVTPEKLVGLNSNEKLVEGDGEADITAMKIHFGIYRARSDVKCVMHCHMPYATSVACLEKPVLEMIHQNSARFYNRFAFDLGYTGLATADEEGDRLARVLGDKTILFMGNHGVLVAASTIHEAFDTIYYVERACMYQVLASATGKKLNVIPDELCEKISKQFYADKTYMLKHFQAVKRMLSNSDVDAF
ncbi:expressed hypothetical protein [Trichoplax adhaerens]|uniref:Class II aldolase/adducin N-terminal domain-containing protein n=1 Tax=Trichoplax adhaerens TaxID=10228 RepID=B3S6Q8_TRIAD|nr:expressed hypothetical protein [Trichoplax adhaerens]EDV21804.1 expressed hypothetical protein [Trichoplax adhaerens]|eukprot:XP_002115952.1 expressed hypothetical protein [Trichoplax adhaerens]